MSHKLAVLGRQVSGVQEPDAEDILTVKYGTAFGMELFTRANNREWECVPELLWLNRAFVSVTYNHRLRVRTGSVRVGGVNKNRA